MWILLQYIDIENFETTLQWVLTKCSFGSHFYCSYASYQISKLDPYPKNQRKIKIWIFDK